jgi:hypothetical protein
VVIAGFFVRQLLVFQEQFGAAVAIRKFHSDDARSIFPNLIIVMFPGETNLLSRTDLEVLAPDRLLFPVAID